MKKNINPLKKRDIYTILSDYDLGNIYEYTELKKGSVQINIFLNTSKGKFVLRYYRRSRDLYSVMFELNVLNYIKNKGYSCPSVIRNREGKLCGIFKGKPFAVFEYIDGVHIKNPTDRQEEELIRNVASLQKLTKGYKPANTFYRSNYGTVLFEKLVKKKAQEIGTENAKKKLHWYMTELKKLVLPVSLPKGICHADFHYTNILYKDNKFHALIDFDDANYTYLIYDLAFLIESKSFLFDYNTWEKVKPGQDIIDFNKARRITEIYQSCRSLNIVEKRYLFDAVKLVILFDCIVFFKRGNADDFNEKKKIECLNYLGRELFYCNIFE